MSYAQGYRDGCRDAARVLRDMEYTLRWSRQGTIPRTTLHDAMIDTASAIEVLDAPKDPDAGTGTDVGKSGCS